MTETTALDDLVENVRQAVRNGYTVDDTLDYEMKICPEYFYPALQDPRYIAYCQDQDFLDALEGDEWTPEEQAIIRARAALLAKRDLVDRLARAEARDTPRQQ